MPTLETERIIPRSALRYKPIAIDHEEIVHPFQRVTRTHQKRDPHTTGGLPSVKTQRRKHSVSLHWSMLMGLAMLLTLLLIWLFQMTIGILSTIHDDLAYGRPRTTHVEAVVEHEAEHGKKAVSLP